jgi:hypothetical protein
MAPFNILFNQSLIEFYVSWETELREELYGSQQKNWWKENWLLPAAV